MKASELAVKTKREALERHDLNGHFELILQMMKLHSQTRSRKFVKTHLLPINLELSICSKLKDLGYKVTAAKDGHIIEIEW